MREFRLYGHLRDQFGPSYTLDAATPAEGILALSTQIPGFREAVEGHEPGFRVRLGRRSIGEEDLARPCSEIVRIVPCVVGAKDGWGQVLAGAILIAAGVAVGYFGGPGMYWASDAMVNMGAMMMLGGVAQALSGNPAYAATALDKGPQDTPSYAFSGPHMTTGQGNPVPLGYGKLRISGALVSLGISPETWLFKGFGGAAPDEVGTMGGDGDTTPWIWAIAPSA